MRVSCSLVLVAVFLVLQAEAAPLVGLPVDLSTLDKVKATSGLTHGAGRLTHLLFGRTVLPLDTNKVLHGHIVDSGLVGHLGEEVTPIGVHASTPRGGALSLLDLPISLDGLAKRQLDSLSSLTNIGSLPGLSSLTSVLPGTSSLPSLPFLSGGMPSLPSLPSMPSLGGLPGLGDMGLAKRQFDSLSSLSSIGSLPGLGDVTGQASSLTSALPGTSSMPSVPFLSGGMPSLPSVPSMPSLGGLPGLGDMPALGGMPSLPSMSSLPSMPSMPSLPSMPSMSSLPSMPSMPSLGGLPGLGDMSSLGSLPGLGDMSSLGGMPGLGSLPLGGESDLYRRDFALPLNGVVSLAQGLPAVSAVSHLPVTNSLHHVEGVTGAVPALSLPTNVSNLEHFPQVTDLPTMPVQTLPSLNRISDPVVGAMPTLPSASSATGLPLESIPAVTLPTSLPSVHKASDLPLVGSLPSVPIASGLTNMPLAGLGGGLL